MNEPFAIEMTARVRARPGRQRFEIIFQAINDAIFIIDPATGRFIEINEPGCRMFGYTKEELVDQDIGFLSSGVYPYTCARRSHF